MNLGRRLALLVGLVADLWNLLLLLARSLLPALTLGMVVLFAWALLFPQPWPFSMTAESEHATLVLDPRVETQWRVDGAVLCVRSDTDPLPLPLLAEAAPCAGRRWHGYDSTDLRELTLRLPAAPDKASSETETETETETTSNGATVHLDTESTGSLSVRIVSGSRAGGTPVLLLPDARTPIPVGREVILHFRHPGKSAPPGRLLLPFSGTGSIGRDVSWSQPALLRKGQIAFYTASQQAVGGRDLVASTTLLPGDRVDLGERARSGGAVAKGFVHFDLTAEHESPPVMRVVAFGAAESVRILRFGEQGFDFSPGLVARISRHSAVATWAVLLLSLLGLMSVYQSCATLGQGSLPEAWRTLRWRWRDLRRGP
jgi:hypothetical protein